MKAKEIRIGNTIKEGFVIGITPRSVHIQAGAFGEPTELKLYEINPIELTEEWFVKFGFDVIDTKGMGKSYNIYRKTLKNGNSRERTFLEIISGSNLYFIGYQYDLYTTEIAIGKVEFVHALQNLYYAITGTELSANDK